METFLVPLKKTRNRSEKWESNLKKWESSQNRENPLKKRGKRITDDESFHGVEVH